MQNRREFLKTAALLSGAVGLWGTLEKSIQKAMAIDPDPGSSYLDAEHIVILMQENRSFDHCYGTLQGVRGYNDPRAITLPDNNPVWVQTNAAGQSFAPFRLNMKDTKATWMGFLPHNWPSQVDARNQGKHDHWLEAKRSGNKHYADMPLTMGHYNRQDIPFYYAFADAFTICDQHFCSSITPTLPNRLYFWTGTVREKPSVDSQANVRNEQVMNNEWSSEWKTFPERLEDHGIPWKIYQNDLSVPTGFSDEEEAWLSNFGCNVMEYFPQYHVNAGKLHRDYFEKEGPSFPSQLAAVKKQLAQKGLSEDETAKLKKQQDELTSLIQAYKEEQKNWDQEVLEKLPPQVKSLYDKAFSTNVGDPSYRELVEMAFQDGKDQRKVQVPKGDVFHQFREDVKAGALPTVSWLVAPERLSDHPESAWYGAWFISEALRILTENPEVWKKTIFILTYDENDGYFDHVPPFVAPHPNKPETGFTSKGIDSSLDYVELEQDRKYVDHQSGERIKKQGPRESPIGLGYRVPLIIASPWSRGGCVCSQVFDNTSILQFLEKFLTQKTGQPVKETNISSWRRAICGDLTSIFQPSPDESESNPQFLTRDPHVEEIYQAKFKPLPSGYKALSKEEIEKIRLDPRGSKWMPSQEPGTRRSTALPYELYVDGSLSDDRSHFTIGLQASKNHFGEQALGCPFTVYARTGKDVIIRNYAVSAGDRLEDSWAIRDFANGIYNLQVYGPNGFFREFIGSEAEPPLEIRLAYSEISAGGSALSGNIELRVANRNANRDFTVELTDRSYKTAAKKVSVPASGSAALVIDTQPSSRWYDFAMKIDQLPAFQWRFAGRVETGKWSITDPAMGGVVG